jgi:hypothetical protein
MSKLPSAAEREAFIREYAKSIGIDPNIAIRVARTEGLGDGIWQSNVVLDYGREQSFGDFQLHLAPEGRKPGLGNAFLSQTGLDPRDPANWKAMNMFALDNAKRGGWSPWFGAKKVGIVDKMGIDGSPAPAASYEAPKVMGSALGSFLDPSDINVRIAENSANPTNLSLDADTQTPGSEQPFLSAPNQTPSKSPQEIYAAYLQALSEVTTPRKPQPLSLQTLDIVSYE